MIRSSRGRLVSGLGVFLLELPVMTFETDILAFFSERLA